MAAGNKARSLRLEIPVEHLPAVIGCLALGTLYGLREGVLGKDTGDVLAWPIFREELEGMIPPGMIDVLAGMDEIDWPEIPGRGRDIAFIEQQIARLQEELGRLERTNYLVAWSDSEEDSGRDTSVGGPDAR